MCGFLAEFTFDSGTISNSVDFESLLYLSKHRGPDSTQIDSGYYYQLGFNRLAILDLSQNGNQPKLSPTKRYHIVFNGEIYNYQQLRNQLNFNQLNSTSDTEVLVHLIDKLGVEKAVKELNGMFAICIIDTKEKKQYLVRDFAGIKPLFYGISEKGVVAASQFNQVFKHRWFNTTLYLRPEIVKEYFAFGYMQAPNTIYGDIFQVNPGQLVIISQNGSIEKQNFHEFNFDKIGEDGPNLKTTLQKSISKAVKRQLVSDVPLASFLSGGIDSPLISAIAYSHKPSIKGFTLGVKSEAMDESQKAKQYAGELNLSHHVEQIDPKDLIDAINTHFEYMTEPFGDFSSIPTFVVTRAARKTHTVMLSGDGADELFFGYPRMLDVMNKKHWFKIPLGLRKPLVRITNKLGLTKSWAPFNYKTISEFIIGKHTQIFKTDIDNFFHSHIGYSKELKELYSINKGIKYSEMLAALRKNEFYAHLQRVLVKVDRMSMANSLEVRVPFLDKDVIADNLNYLPKKFDSNSNLKILLKDFMKHFYSESTINHTKQGFTVPLSKWLKGPLAKEVKSLIYDNSIYGCTFLNESNIRKYINDFFEGVHDNHWGVWHIYAWQKWAKTEGLIKVENRSN